MKKFFSLLLGALLAVVCFVGCGDMEFDDDIYDDSATPEELGANPNAPEITLAHWDSSGSLEGAVLNTVLKQFYATHPDGQKIRVKVEIMGMYEQTMPTILASGDEDKPEIIMMPDGSFNSWMAQYASQFENLDPYIQKSGFDETKLWDGAVSRYKYKYENHSHVFGNGSVYALPKDVSPNVMFYNKDFFFEKQVEIPKNTDGSIKRMTIDEGVEMWRKLIVGEENKNALERRYALGNMPPESMVWSAGSDFLNESRTGFITDSRQIAGFKKAYQKMVDLVDEKIVPDGTSMSGSSTSSLFLTGKVACYIGGIYDTAQLRNSSFDWDITYIPAFEDNLNVNGYSGSVGYSMWSGTDSSLKDLAYSVIEYISSEEAQRIMTEMGFNIPLQKSIAGDTAFIDAQRAKKPYNYEVFLESLRYQPSGTWRYTRNNVWKERLSTEAAKLFQRSGYTVDDFVAALPGIVNGSL